MIGPKFALIAVLVVLVGGVFAADDDDDHSKHCHIDGFPSIHTDIGDSIELPGACLKLVCKSTDLYEVVSTCEHDPNSKENIDFADKLEKGEQCPK